MSRPFDEARYKGLLEGLDTTVLKFSEVRGDNEKLRIDDGYFSKLAVLTLRRIESLPHVRLGDATSEFRKGIFDIKADSYVESGIPFVRIANLKNGLIDTTDIAYISHEAHAIEAKTCLRFGDVVLSKTAIPAASFVNLSECNVSQDTIAVRLAPAWRKRLRSGFVIAFLNSRHGLALMNRQFQGNVQAHLSLPDGKKLPIPLFGLGLQDAIHNAYLLADEKLQEAKKQAAQAEQTLLRALGLKNWQPPELLTYTRRASEAFAAGRLDAEHFQESYYSLAEILRGYQHGCIQLGEICPNPVNGVEIREYEEEGIPYLRVGDVKNFTVDLNTVKRVSPIAAEREIGKVALRVGDVLVSRSGSLAVTGVVEQEWVHTVISSHLIRVRLEDADFDPYYVAVFLSGLPGKMQIEQCSNGGVQPEINQPALKSILIPRLDVSQQKKIRNCIFAAHAARRQAHAQLEAAKRAVEIAIEDSETAALAYLAEFLPANN